MPWKRGTEQKQKPGQLSAFHLPLAVQSVSLIDASDPKKGSRIRCLGASDRINSGRIRIRASAWRFRKQGAPMLYEHGQDPRVGRLPLGRWDKFEVQEGVGLVAEGTLDEFEQSDPRAAIVADIKAKRLTDVSVGHAPAKLDIAKQDGGAFLDVQETTLGEISFVAVGMDGDATYEMMAASALGYEWSDNDGGGQSAGNGGIMDRKLLIQMLNMSGAGLKEDANDAEVLAALQRFSQAATLGGKASEILSSLGLKADASIEMVKQAIANLKQPENFVPKSEYDKLKVKTQAAEIDSLISEHKQIPKGQVDFAKTLLAQGHEKDTPGRKLFDSWVQTLPSISTRQITGAGASTPPPAGHEQEEQAMEITDEDREWCQLLGYFRDERDPKTGKVSITGVERMAQMAEVTTSEALEWMFAQAVPETKMEKVMREARQAQHARK